MVHGMSEDDSTAQGIQGLTVSKNDIVCVFEKIKAMPAVQRLNLQGLEQGREDIILAGTAIVIKILDYFEKDDIIISHADLLEGILLHFTEGEKNE